MNSPARSNDAKPTEALNQLRAGARTDSTQARRGGGEAAEGRAKTHPWRKGPITTPSLAVRRILEDGERCGVCFNEHAEESDWMEGRPAEDDRLRGLHDRLQRGAARIFLAIMLVGIVGIAFGTV